jgi:hypothetical protein
MEITEIEKEVLGKFKLPVRYDNHGQYIFDADNQMVADVRAWGYLERFDNAELLQDTLGEMIAKAFNEKYQPK